MSSIFNTLYKRIFFQKILLTNKGMCSIMAVLTKSPIFLSKVVK